MPSAESKQLIEMIRSQRGSRPANPTLAESRQGMESMARPADADVQVEPVDAGGVSSEWVSGPDADAGRVVLYLHGGGYMRWVR